MKTHHGDAPVNGGDFRPVIVSVFDTKQEVVLDTTVVTDL